MAVTEKVGTAEGDSRSVLVAEGESIVAVISLVRVADREVVTVRVDIVSVPLGDRLRRITGTRFFVTDKVRLPEVMDAVMKTGVGTFFRDRDEVPEALPDDVGAEEVYEAEGDVIERDRRFLIGLVVVQVIVVDVALTKVTLAAACFLAGNEGEEVAVLE